MTMNDVRSADPTEIELRRTDIKLEVIIIPVSSADRAKLVGEQRTAIVSDDRRTGPRVVQR